MTWIVDTIIYDIPYVKKKSFWSTFPVFTSSRRSWGLLQVPMYSPELIKVNLIDLKFYYPIPIIWSTWSSLSTTQTRASICLRGIYFSSRGIWMHVTNSKKWHICSIRGMQMIMPGEEDDQGDKNSKLKQEHYFSVRNYNGWNLALNLKNSPSWTSYPRSSRRFQ